MNKYLSFLGFALLNLASACAWTKDNPCGILRIQIANLTHHSCILIESQVIHGLLQDSPPTAILSDDSKHFDVEQTLHGPEIILKYSCGDKEISFQSKQDFCWLTAGKITGQVLFYEPKIEAFYRAAHGSAFWKKPGTINWNLRIHQ